jgi:Anti-sigma-K factor rskA
VWHPDPDQLALLALPAEEPDPRALAHLDECRLCRGQVDSLRRTVALARDGADPVDDGEGPPEAVWRAISDELALEEPSPRSVAGRRSRWRVLVPAAAAVLGLLAGVAIGYAAFAGASGAGSVVAQLGPVGAVDPAGAGQVRMARDGADERMEVTLTGVDDLAGGDYLQVWLLDPASARLVAMGGLAPVAGEAGAFRGTFTVPPGLPLSAFGTVDVSIERWDGDPGHSQRSVLRGQLA